MFNLIKLDFYRLFRTKSFYVVGIILAIFIAMVMFSLGSNDPELMNEYYAYDINNLQMIDLLYQTLMSGMIPMVIGIGAAIFICTDYNSGYIKNIASNVKNKPTIAISKFIVSSIGMTIYFILMILLTYILGNLYIGNVVIGDVSLLVQYVGMDFFLCLVFLALVLLAASFFRSSAASITLIVVSMMATQLGYRVIEHFLGINFIPYSPIMNMQMLNPVDTSGWTTAFISGIIFLIVYLVGSIVVLEKKDIT